MMGRTIRDFDTKTLEDIIAKANRFRYYEHVDMLKWITFDEKSPVDGQMILACRSNEYVSWVDPVVYHDGMCFDYAWNWAKEASEYDAWMMMPLPMKYKEVF